MRRSGGDRRPVSTPALALVTGFGPFGTDTYLPALPAVALALAVPASTAQLSITVFLVGLAVGQLLAGPISDAAGRRGLLLGSGVALVVASAACVVAADAGTLLVARTVQGLAGGAGSAIGVAVVSDRYSGPEAAARFGTLSAIRLIAPVVAPGIGGLILLVSDFRGVFVFMTAFSALVLLIAAVGLPETLEPAMRQPAGLRHLGARIVDLLRRPAFRAPVIVQCIAQAGFFVYIGGSSFVLQQQLGIGEGLYSIVFATDAAAMVVTSVLFRRFVLRVPVTRLRAIGLWMSSGGAAALLLVELVTAGGAGLAAVWVLLGVAVAGNGFCIPATTVLAQEAGRPSAGTAASLSGGLAFLVGALTTPLTGLIGVQTVLVLALGMAVLSTTALVASRLLPRG
ncbi:Bcr/CflA family efflux MFS transporter [Amnibacterium endophyticum]|uniref:Bcr/CflA family efflux MFS transporter n=1 Tax=Amnibacterium endophyticum TaxID=2109337 RepID=A0ABW4LDI1_9MICO